LRHGVEWVSFSSTYYSSTSWK